MLGFAASAARRGLLPPRQGPHAGRRRARRQCRRHDSRVGRRPACSRPPAGRRSRVTSIRSRTTSRSSRSTRPTSAQYEAKLTRGQAALLRKYPQNFRMNVYPTRRTVGYPKAVTDRVIAQAGKVSLQGFGLKDLNGSTTPFPIPAERPRGDLEPPGALSRRRHRARRALVPGAPQRRLSTRSASARSASTRRTSRTPNPTGCSMRSAISPSRRRCAARSSWCTSRWTRWPSSARPGSTTPAQRRVRRAPDLALRRHQRRLRGHADDGPGRRLQRRARPLRLEAARQARGLRARTTRT